MSHDRNDSVASPARGLFASGIVLGLSLGLVGGHLLLFTRNVPDRAGASTAEQFPPFDPNGFLFSAEPDLSVPDEVSFSVAPFEASDDVGRVTISDQDDDDQLHFFPEAVARERGSSHPATSLGDLEADEGESAKRTWLASADEVESDRPDRRTVELPTSTDEVPQALQPLPGASPINERTQQSEQLTRSIVNEELPDATPQERDVWCEVLQGLPADDIKGILRMRKHIGPGNPFPAMSVLSPLATRRPVDHKDEPPGADVESGQKMSPDGADGVAVHDQLARMARYNRANDRTIGFKRLVPVLVEVPWEEATEGAGIRMSRAIRDMTQGELLATHRPLDVAIDGPGFLKVRQRDAVRYTRDGRLTVDNQGRLKLLAHAETWLIDPPIVVPSEATAVAIAENGVVSVNVAGAAEPTEIGTVHLWNFLNPESLRMDATGLYEPTDETIRPRQAPTAASDGCTLVQGHLEASNAGNERIQPTR